MALAEFRSARPAAYRLPVLGAIAREWAEGDPDFPLVLVLVLVLALVAAWGCAVALWGLPALYLPAVAAVPGLMALLVALTRG